MLDATQRASQSTDPRSALAPDRLILGTMRLLERNRDAAHWLSLFRAARAAGVTTFHSSDEYESFPFFRSLLPGMSKAGASGRIRHAVKLAEPHFGSFRFDPDRLRQRVDRYLAALGSEHLDIVQWMWRGDLKDEDGRLAGLSAQSEVIGDTFRALRREGKIGRVLVFPYTTGFAEAVLAQAWCDGLAVYVNPMEAEFLGVLEGLPNMGRSAIAIRPLAAGKVTEHGWAAGASLRWSLTKPGVDGAVVSCSTEPHLLELLEGLRQGARAQDLEPR